jgi:hypothetical protein
LSPFWTVSIFSDVGLGILRKYVIGTIISAWLWAKIDNANKNVKSMAVKIFINQILI